MLWTTCPWILSEDCCGRWKKPQRVNFAELTPRTDFAFALNLPSFSSRLIMTMMRKMKGHLNQSIFSFSVPSHLAHCFYTKKKFHHVPQRIFSARSWDLWGSEECSIDPSIINLKNEWGWDFLKRSAGVWWICSGTLQSQRLQVERTNSTLSGVMNDLSSAQNESFVTETANDPNKFNNLASL